MALTKHLANPRGRTARIVHALAWLALFGAGTWIIWHGFWKPSLWIDEYGTEWTVAEGYGETVARAVHVQCQSPLYYLLARGAVGLLGHDNFALRLPSVLCGTLTLALAYPLALSLLRERHVALAAVVTFAVQKDLLIAAQDARPYALGILLVVVCFLTFLALLEGRRPLRRLAYVLAATLVFYAHYPYGALLAVQAAYLLLARASQRGRLREWLVTYASVAVLCAPGFLQLLTVFSRRTTLSWLPSLELPELFVRLQAMLLWFFDTQLLGLAAAFLFLFTAGRGRSEPPRDTRGGLVLLWFVLPFLALALLPNLLGFSLLATRHLAMIAPASALISAWVLGLAGRTWLGRYGPTAVFALAAFAWNLVPVEREQGTFARHLGHGWTEAVRHVESAAQHGETVFYCTGVVECDEVAGPDPDPMRLSFVSWPIVSNSSRPLDLVPLPYRAVIPRALALERVRRMPQGATAWGLGAGEGLRAFLREVQELAGFEVEALPQLGVVQLARIHHTSR